MPTAVGAKSIVSVQVSFDASEVVVSQSLVAEVLSGKRAG